MNQLFASGSQSIGASASVLPMNTQDWFPLGLTGLISWQAKGLSRVFPLLCEACSKENRGEMLWKTNKRTSWSPRCNVLGRDTPRRALDSWLCGGAICWPVWPQRSQRGCGGVWVYPDAEWPSAGRGKQIRLEVRRQGGAKKLRVGAVGTSMLSEAKRGLRERAGWEGKSHLQTQRKPGPSQQPPLQPLAYTLVPSSLFSTENLGRLF